VRWRKAGSHAVPGFGNTWSLHLDLVSSENHYCGTFVVFCRYKKRDLQVDINLLTSVFAPILADALHRMPRSSEDFLTANQNSALLQARVG
jgi:hypothetical protein